MSVNELYQALQALYHHTDSTVKEQASQWLEQWQQSPDSWQVSHDVLQNPDAGLEAHYFAAQTLRTKVQRDFEELPASSAAALRDSLISLLTRYANGHAPVRVQLSLSLAALSTHLPASNWSATGVVGWLVQRLSTEPPAISLPCMLEILTVLPQEATSYQPALRPERRREVHNEMVASLPLALQILSGCLETGGDRVRKQVLEAFAAWLKLSGGEGLTGAMITGSPLVIASMDGLDSSDTFDSAADAIVELIYCTSERGRPREDMMSIVQQLVPRIMALRPRFHIFVAQAVAEREGHPAPPESESHHFLDPEEGAKAVARLFAEVGEAYTDLVSEGKPEVITPVEALLDVASHPDDAVCSISFNFWHRLSRALTVGLHPQPLGSDEPVLEENERQRRVAIFSPIFERLVILIRGRVKFPADFDEWHRDERSDFKRGRVAIGDTLMDAACVLGGARTVQLLAEPLLELSQRVVGGERFDWQAAEAALYCIRCIHRVAPPPCDQLLLSLFSSLPALPQPPQLAYTVALTVGAYADWLSDTASSTGADGQRLLNQLLEMLSKGLADAESSGACALSIRRLCDGCATLLVGSMDALMQLYTGIQGSGDVAENSTDLLDLDEDDVGQLVEAVALVASALPDGQRQQHVQRMLDVVVQPMQQILVTPAGTGLSTPPIDPTRAQLLLPLTDRVTTIFRAVKDPGDVAEALQRLWPWLEAALDVFAGDVDAAEKVCRAPRYAVRNAGKAVAQAVPMLSQGLPRRFEASGHSCFLFVGSELVKTFGDDPSFDGDLGPMLSRMLLASCSTLRTLADVSDKPDLADDTFLLAGRGLSYASRLVMTPELLIGLLDCAQAGVLVQHREACCSIMAFLVRLLDPATHRKCPPQSITTLQEQLAPRAPMLVRLLLAGVAGALPGSRLQQVTDVLYAILKVAASNGLQWIIEAVQMIPDEAVPHGDAQRFLSACQTVVAEGLAVDDEKMLMDSVVELSEVCRRSRKAAQTAQRSLLPSELHYIIR